MPRRHVGSEAGSRQADSEDSGYWDLVYLLYPEAAEAAGLGLVHELVSSWPLIECTLAVRITASCNSFITLQYFAI